MEFVERNIIEDSTALEELKELGVFSTPVTIIDDEVVIGFDKENLKGLLNR